MVKTYHPHTRCRSSGPPYSTSCPAQRSCSCCWSSPRTRVPGTASTPRSARSGRWSSACGGPRSIPPPGCCLRVRGRWCRSWSRVSGAGRGSGVERAGDKLSTQNTRVWVQRTREWSGLETNSELRLQEYEFREPGAGWRQTLNLEYKSMSSENQRVERAGDKLWAQITRLWVQRTREWSGLEINFELRVQEYE